MDDVLVYGKSVGEHNQHLEATLHKLQEANLTLNEEKCELSKPSVEFLGTLIDSEGVHINPKKVEAILKMKTPQGQTELRRFRGMVNQLSKLQPQIAELSKPLRDLLQKPLIMERCPAASIYSPERESRLHPYPSPL